MYSISGGNEAAWLKMVKTNRVFCDSLDSDSPSGDSINGVGGYMNPVLQNNS